MAGENQIFNFLAKKIMSVELRQDQLQALFFWGDLLLEDFEKKKSVRFDSEDRRFVKKKIENWFYSVCFDLIRESKDNQRTGSQKLKNAVYCRVNYILFDLAFGEGRKGKGIEESNAKDRKGEEKERKRKKEPASLFTKNRKPMFLENHVELPDRNGNIENGFLKRELLKKCKARSINDLSAVIKEEQGERAFAEVVKDYINSISVEYNPMDFI